MKRTPFIILAALAFSLNLHANLGETQEELFKRYGKATDSVGTKAGFGTHFWRTSSTSQSAEMSQWKCMKEEFIGVDSSTLNRVMRTYEKPGQTWNGSVGLLLANETRVFRMKGEGLEKGKTPVVKVTRDAKRVVYRAEFTWE
ncbi:MAG: hypothetical protein LBV12_12670 [Puniceicoccales bacterium]|jgi:hypothetical protein|nr:hypothetical protein [Puniceicoccales bacterium]